MDFERSLQDTIFSMLCDSRYMFYGLFLAELNKTFDDEFPTACVGRHPNSPVIQLVIGKKFWEHTLDSPSKKKFILIHELNFGLLA